MIPWLCIYLLLAAASAQTTNGDQNEITEIVGKLCPDGTKGCKRFSERLSRGYGKAGKFSSDPENAQKLTKVVDTIKENIDNFKTGDAKAIMKGLLEVAAVMSVFLPPPANAICASLFSLVAGFLGENPESVGDVMRRVLHDELKNARFDELQDEFISSEMVLGVMQAVLYRAMESDVLDEMTELDVDYINAQVTTTAGLRVLGMLKSVIQRHMVTAKDFKTIEQVATAIHVYIKLSAIQTLLLNSARTFYDECSHTATTHLIMDKVMIQLRNQDKMWLDFLQNPTTVKEGMVALVMLKKRADYAQTIQHLENQLEIDIFKTNKEVSMHRRMKLHPGRANTEWLCLYNEYMAYASSTCSPADYFYLDSYTDTSNMHVEYIKLMGFKAYDYKSNQDWYLYKERGVHVNVLFTTVQEDKDPKPFYMMAMDQYRQFEGFQPQPFHATGNYIRPSLNEKATWNFNEYYLTRIKYGIEFSG